MSEPNPRRRADGNANSTVPPLIFTGAGAQLNSELESMSYDVFLSHATEG